MTEFKNIFDEKYRQFKDLRPMTEDETQVLVRLMLLEADEKTKPDDLERAIGLFYPGQLPFVLRLMIKRLEVHAPGMLVSPRLIFWLAYLTSNLPGRGVLYAHGLAREFLRTSEGMSLLGWVNLYPFGIPTEKTLTRAWDDQKGYNLSMRLDNYLDSAEAWE